MRQVVERVERDCLKEEKDEWLCGRNGKAGLFWRSVVGWEAGRVVVWF